VVNLRNDKSVDVRINDRGPFVEGRIIDLSKAAARTIDLLRPGITPVRVEVIGATATVSADLFAVQVGAFRDIRNAKRNVTTMQARYGAARLSTRDGDPVLWRVSVARKEHRAPLRLSAFGGILARYGVRRAGRSVIDGITIPPDLRNSAELGPGADSCFTNSPAKVPQAACFLSPGVSPEVPVDSLCNK
jgi:hypothetical protein